VTVRAVIGRLPSAPGVYRFRDAAGRALYIGRAVDLRRRVASYWADLGDRAHLRGMVARIERVEAVACDSEHEAAWLERNLHEHSLPYWNRTAGGQEVPVYIRLVRRSGSARLGVIHQPSTGARHFGPYLGGVKVRLAVSALHRALPLTYAGDALGGFDRDMARVRGVESGGRDTLVATVTAALEREPEAGAALRAELERRRDRASSALAFELAGRVQEEIEALEWVLAEQKVTAAEPVDLDLYGWSDGVLVTFTMRGGRVRSWSQRACPHMIAPSRLALTPVAWQPFVQRNAELAARLRT